MANIIVNVFIGLLVMLLSFNYLKAQMVPAFFVFGDSLVDVGNNNHLPVSIAKADFPHNGIDFPTKKPTGRFSNGKNAADLIAQKLGLPTSPPYLSLSSKNATSFLTGVSFASGGAGIFNGSDDAFAQSIPLTKQVSYYEIVREAMKERLGSSAAESIVSESLFAIVIASNDIFGYSESSDRQNQYTPGQFCDLMTSTLKDRVKEIYSTGARKFLFIGVGPLGCTPSQRSKNETEECNEELNSYALLYNQKLKSMLQQLKSELKGLAYSYFDIYPLFLDIIQKPSNYGYKEVKAACCGLGKLKAKIPCIPISTYCTNRKDHVFWDIVHPTEATTTIIADALFDGPTQFSYPINLRQLVTA